MLEKTVKKILTAKVYEAAIETPLEQANSLSQRFENNILIAFYTKENNYNPSAWLDLDENIIYLGDYILKIEEVNNG